MGELIGFGPTPHAREIARERAERIAAAQAFTPDWASQRPTTTEQRRAAILGNTPRCIVCEVPWARRIRPPADGICRKCRAEAADREADEIAEQCEATLFDEPGLDS